MKTKPQYIRGRGVRYYDYRAGAVEVKNRWFLKASSAVMSTLVLAGAGTYFGMDILTGPQPAVMQSAISSVQASETVESASETTNLLPHEARLDDRLTAEIRDVVKDVDARNVDWAISVRDLNSPRMANINAETPMESASLYKLFLLPSLEKRISANNWKSYAGRMSIKDCVDQMLRVSDNNCPQGLGNYIGWKNINPHNESLGFSQTTIGSKSGNQTTARDTTEMMYRLQNSMILSDKARRAVFDALYAQQYKSGIPAGCGAHCLVANKTGDIDGFRHDTAVVTNGDVRYVVTIMTKGASWNQIAEVAAGIDSAMNRL